ncbi:MAG: hypothetical protein HOP19_02295 [Acidobacteria bacterium]|nr:hypothetical protein [Acidobacteriota bacterium]
MEVSFEQVLTEARQLPLSERRLLRAVLTSDLEREEGSKSIEQIALEQGKRPLTLEQLLGPTPDGSDDDDIDEWLRQSREEQVEIVREKQLRLAALDELTQLSQELGLGYD